MTRALPAIMLLGELHAGGTACGAFYDAIGPASRNHILTAIGGIFKVFNGLQEGGWFNESSMTETDGVVNYIFTIILLINSALYG